MENLGVHRVAQRHGAAEGRNERHFGLQSQRQCGDAGGRSHIAKQGQNIPVNKFSGVLGAALGVIAVVELHNFQLTPADTPTGVDLTEPQLSASVVLDTQLRGGPGERG